MQTPETIDYLIIGLGLAGSSLAWLLEQHGQSFVVVDDVTESSASRIAAGVINPVAGQRLVKHPKTEIFLAAARAFYAGAADFFKQPFYFERPMIRLFSSAQERKIWAEKKANPAYSLDFGETFDAQRVWPVSGNRDGGYHQHNCGYLDARRLLDAMKAHFRATNRLIETEFRWDQLTPDANGMVWNGARVGAVISCEGFRAKSNPYFSWLPLQLSKGEIITMESTADLPEWIVNQGKTLVPLDRRIFKFGATYERRTLDNMPSAIARDALFAKVRELLPAATRLQCLKQEAGIRSGSLDKNPFAGLHPTYPRLGIFNGFGSKGVLTIPYYAECFVQFLLHGKDLPAEICIDRYPIKNEAG